MRLTARVIYAAAFAFALAAQAAAAPPRYTAMATGGFIENRSINGLNNLGQVTRIVRDPVSGSFRGFRTKPNQPIDFASDILIDSLSAPGLNDLGQVVGTYNAASGQADAFRTAPNAPLNPATDDISSSRRDSIGMGVNNLGQAIGSSGHAFRTQPNQPVIFPADDLGVLSPSDTFSYGYGVNDSGRVVGYSTDAFETMRRAFRTQPNAPINPATDALGTFGGTESVAYAINDAGWAVGSARLQPGSITAHAFRCPPDRALDPSLDDLGTLGGPGSIALDINNDGWVVGGSNTDPLDINFQHAFLFDGTRMLDLNSLVDPLPGVSYFVGANGVNDVGQILAYSQSGAQYLLTPVPEPSALALFVCACLVIVAASRRGISCPGLRSILKGVCHDERISPFRGTGFLGPSSRR